MKELESRAADLPFMEAFQAAMLFQGALFESLGVTPTSSATVDAPIPKKKKAPASPSAV
jgi:Na+/glutamate symporter